MQKPVANRCGPGAVAKPCFKSSSSSTSLLSILTYFVLMSSCPLPLWPSVTFMAPPAASQLCLSGLGDPHLLAAGLFFPEQGSE